MRAYVDPERCIGCGLCTSIAPDVFAMNADGKAEAVCEDKMRRWGAIAERAGKLAECFASLTECEDFMTMIHDFDEKTARSEEHTSELQSRE